MSRLGHPQADQCAHVRRVTSGAEASNSIPESRGAKELMPEAQLCPKHVTFVSNEQALAHLGRRVPFERLGKMPQ